jgi:hypothetical protein
MMNKRSLRCTKTGGTVLVGLLASILLMSLLVMPASRASARFHLLTKSCGVSVGIRVDPQRGDENKHTRKA